MKRAPVQPPKLYTIYDPPQDPGIDFTVLDESTGEYVPEPSLTEQSHKDSCDINKILERYARTGELPTMINSDPRWGDFTDVPSYQKALEIVGHAQDQFESLDAPIRKRFGNDPQEFLAFASDPKNLPEMVKLGLATERGPSPATLDDVVTALKAPQIADRLPEGPGSPASPTVPQEPSKPVRRRSET